MKRWWRVRARASLSTSLSTVVRESTTVQSCASPVTIRRYSRELAPQLIATLMMTPPVLLRAMGLIILSYFVDFEL